jgi:GntR family transcriptional regulator
MPITRKNGARSTPAATSRIEFTRTQAPLYRDVAAALENAIANGVWKPGDRIPTEAELESLFNASRGTLRMAISELVRKQLLHRQAGSGTFVLGPSFKSLERYFRYESLANDPRIVPHNKVLDQRFVPVDEPAAAALAIPADAEVAYLRRLRYHQNEPFLIVDSFFPMAVWNTIAGADFGCDSLYDEFKQRCGLYVVCVDEYLRADLANDAEAALLGINVGSAVIRVERTSYTFADKPVEYRRAVGRADRFRYHVCLR